MNVKTKIRLGLIFLLAMIILLAVAGSFYVNKLADESENILKDNYNTLQYTKKMIEALDGNDDDIAVKIFEENLLKQEHNITEIGEGEATKEMRQVFELYKSGKRDALTESELRKKILHVQELNMNAIVQKNDDITRRTKNAFAFITMLGTLCFLLSFTFVINFPKWIADPIALFTGGIRSISKKDYTARIHIEARDEFGELAGAFNNMAKELDAWEHSNVSKLMFEKSRIETIINNMRDAIVGLDENNNVLFVNSVAIQLLNLQETEVIGKYAPDVALRNDLFRTLLKREEKDKLLKIYADNKESYFNKDTLEILSNGKRIGEVLVLRNITKFQELDLAKTNFIATVSHELKTPISSILMSSKLLDDERIGKVNEEQKHLVQSIKEDSQRLLKITGELLNLTQAETGKIQLNLEAADVKEIIRYAVEANKIQAENKKVAIEIVCPDIVQAVKADTEKTAWVLNNLLSNAIRYSPQNSKVIISVAQIDQQLEFSVRDFGKGIEAKYSDRIFDRYFRIPGTDTEGTGLGLAISREFIEAQGGKIKLDSTFTEGSKFSFVLNI